MQAPPQVILLDLNYTFVENTKEAHRLPAVYNVGLESYRQWMLPYLRAHAVVLITVRPKKYQEQTLARIRELCDGWQPHLACFNEWRVAAPVSKERCLQRDVFPIYGKPEAGTYLALESNKDTRAMYAGHGIPAKTWADLQFEMSPSNPHCDFNSLGRTNAPTHRKKPRLTSDASHKV